MTKGRAMSDFVPYADESEVLSLGELAIENRVDRLTLHGRVELTRDQQGLALARRLKAVLDAAVGVLEADENLPEAVRTLPADTVRNPFG